MIININGINLNYHVSGHGKNVLLLHGWGGEINVFAPVHRHLEKHFTTYSLDFPGFGQSDSPATPWGTEEYTNLIISFIKQLNIHEPIVIGHSFGGRVGIRLAAANLVKKLVLVDSAGIRPKRKPEYYIKVYTYKALKIMAGLPLISEWAGDLVEKMRRKTGSKDYQNVSGVMRDTLVRVVNEDLRHLLPLIKVPTLLVWGENDTATPLADGKLMEKLIPDAGLVAFKDAGHFSYLDKQREFLLVLDSFLKPDMEANND